MDFSSEILFFFSSLGAFNGLLLGLYFLFFAQPKHISNQFLGLLLVVLSVRVGKSIFFYFNTDLANVYLQIGITACVFIGPFLYFYIASIVAPMQALFRSWKYQLLFLFPLICWLGVRYPYQMHRPLWKTVFMNIIFLEWLFYLIAAGFLLRPLFAKLVEGRNQLQVIEIWILNVFIGNVLIWVAYFLANYTSYIVGALSFSFVSYLLILMLIFAKRKHSVIYSSSLRYANREIDDPVVTTLLNKLQLLMEDEELYKNPNLKSAMVAKNLGVSVHQLSQLLNNYLGKNFSTWVNEFRIKEAQRMIMQEDRYSLEHVGFACGFNSASTFFATFKKMVGTTPAKYRDSQ